MLADLPILSLCIWVPIVGGLWVVFAGSRVPDAAVRKDALLFSILTFALSLMLWRDFDNGIAAMQFVERTTWILPFDIFYHIGIDGIALPLAWRSRHASKTT